MRGRRWTEEEDALLKKLVQQNGKQWSLIASKMENRTASQVSSRWEKCINPTLTKGPFSAAEDEIVIDYVKKNGPTQWPRLAEILKVRSPKQCRERWFNHLDPNISKDSWSREEDLIILEQHQTIGPKWSVISRFLPHRSDNAIKNRWNSSISKRIKYAPNGRPILLEDNFKKSHKSDKPKTRPNLQPLPIPATPQPARWNVEITSRTGTIPISQPPIFISRIIPLPQSIQQGVQAPLDSRIPIAVDPSIYNIKIQNAQIPQTQLPQGPAPKRIAVASISSPKSNSPIPTSTSQTTTKTMVENTEETAVEAVSAAPPPQTTPTATVATKTETGYPFNPFGSSTPTFSYEVFSPTSPNPLFFQSTGMLSPLKRSDRNVFK